MQTSILLIHRETIPIDPLRREFGDRRLLLRIAPSMDHARRLTREFSPGVVVIDADVPDALLFVADLRASDRPIPIVGITDSLERRTELQAIGIETIILKREGPKPIVDAVLHYVDPDALAPHSDRTEVLVVDDEKEFL